MKTQIYSCQIAGDIFIAKEVSMMAAVLVHVWFHSFIYLLLQKGYKLISCSISQIVLNSVSKCHHASQVVALQI